MNISIEVVQELAPDQSSLNAAKKLMNPAKWPLRGKATSINSIWGQCQGSGANPYYTMADVSNHGYKCTCPSRKFPCKHVLALLWQFSNSAPDFTESEPPEWVHDWLGRRRKQVSSSPTEDARVESKSKALKDINAVDTDKEITLSAAELAKKEETRAKRIIQTKANTNAAISSGLEELEQWLNDQIRTGISNFIKELKPRCRQIAARLVDAKASNLASRLDELPAKLIPLPLELQAITAIKELGQLVLLCESWFADSADADTRRAIANAETRDQLVEDNLGVSCNGTWEKVGEKITTRRDGLISHASWLLRINDKEPIFALLLDHYPASTGKRDIGLSIGTCLEGELAFYPSRKPLRALLLEYNILTNMPNHQWPIASSDLCYSYQHQLSSLPWSEELPYVLEGGRILRDNDNQFWWQSKSTNESIPLSNSHIPALLLGSRLSALFILWDGHRAELLSARTEKWGSIAC